MKPRKIKENIYWMGSVDWDSRLFDALVDKGVRVDRFNLAVTNIGKLAMALVDAATIVVGTATILAGPHPYAAYAAFLAIASKHKQQNFT